MEKHFNEFKKDTIKVAQENNACDEAMDFMIEPCENHQQLLQAIRFYMFWFLKKKELPIDLLLEYCSLETLNANGIYVRQELERIEQRKPFTGAVGVALIDTVVKEVSFEESSYGVTVEFMFGNSRIELLGGSSKIDSMYDNSQIGTMENNSCVRSVLGQAKIGLMRGSASVLSLFSDSRIEVMEGDSKVEYLQGNSSVGTLKGNSVLSYLTERSTVDSITEKGRVRLRVSR